MIAPINSLIGKQPLANIATNSAAINSMADAVNKLRNLTFDTRYFSVTQNPAGIFVTTRPSASSAVAGDTIPYTFKCSLAGNVVTIQAGTVRLHGIGNYPISTSTVTLTSATEWVFVSHNRDHSDSGIGHQYEEPTSDTNTLRVPLAFYTMADDSSFALTSVHHLGDISIDAPLR